MRCKKGGDSLTREKKKEGPRGGETYLDEEEGKVVTFQLGGRETKGPFIILSQKKEKKKDHEGTLTQWGGGKERGEPLFIQRKGR